MPTNMYYQEGMTRGQGAGTLSPPPPPRPTTQCPFTRYTNARSGVESEPSGPSVLASRGLTSSMGPDVPFTASSVTVTRLTLEPGTSNMTSSNRFSWKQQNKAIEN